MTSSDFARSLRETRPLLELLRLLRHPMRFHSGPSDAFRNAAFSPIVPYADVFRIGLENQDHCFLLEDMSYFQLFHAEEGAASFSLRYAFYPNPFLYVALDEFLDEYGLVGSDPRALEFYHQFLSEQSGADGFGPFRYEVDFEAYRPLRHPCAHLHIGRNTSIRIPLDRILTPKAFVLFMAKAHFPDAWGASDSEEGVPNHLDQVLGTENGSCLVLE